MQRALRLTAALLLGLLVALPASADVFKKAGGTDGSFKKGKFGGFGGGGAAGFNDLSHSVEFSDTAYVNDDGYLRATTGEALGITNTATLAAWIKFNTLTFTGVRLFFGISEDDAAPYNNGITFLAVPATPRTFVSADDDLSDGDPSAAGAPNRFEQYATTGLVVSTWHLIAVTYDQGAATLSYFVDGVEIAVGFGSGAFPVLNDAADRTIFMGGDRINLGRSAAARIAVLGAWDVVLTATEQVAIFETGSPDVTRDWRTDFGNYSSGADLQHYYRGTSATLSDFTTDIVGSNDLDDADATDGPTDSNMIADAP